jgi:hypothetical protein
MQLALGVPDTANIFQTDAQILFAMKLFETGKLPFPVLLEKDNDK